MVKNKIKLMVVSAFLLPVAAIAMLNFGGVQSASRVDDDVAKTYKAKCAMCHGPTALKKYDPCMAMEDQVDAILNGKKGEKPPYMPAYEPKGWTTEQATAAAQYMVGLRTPEDGELQCPTPTDGGS